MSAERGATDDPGRLFPLIDASLYEGSPGTSGGRFLRLAREPVPLRERLLLRTARRRLRHVLDLHRQALQAELAAHWECADFFWGEFSRALDSMWSSDDVWETGARLAAVAPEESPSGRVVRDRFLDEVVLDVHGALYAGLAPAERAFVHAAAVQTHLPRSTRTSAELRHRFGAMLEAWVVAARDAKKPNATALATALLERFPDDRRFLQLAVECRVGQTLGELTNREGTSSALSDARHLGQAIDWLNALRACHPRSPLVFDALGLLYHVRAIKLANGEAVADAVGEAERAVAFSPGSEDIQKTREQIRGLMTDLQARMRQVTLEVAAQPGATLSAQGLQLEREASRGFREAEEFHESGQAARVAEGLTAAHEQQFADVAGPSPAVTAADPPAALRAQSAEPRPRRVPFGYWLSAPRDLALKTCAAVSVAILLAVTGVNLGSIWYSRIAEAAWTGLTESRKRDDRVGMIRAAESFFATPARVRGGAERDAEAYAMYSEAIVRWFLDLPDAPSDPAALEHLRAYQRVAEAKTKEEAR